MWNPSNTPMPGPIQLTITPNGSSIGSRTFTQPRNKLLIGYNGSMRCPHGHPKISPFLGRSPPIYCLILGSSRRTTPNGIQMQSAVFPQSTGQTDRHTGRPTTGLGDITYTNTCLRSIDCSDAANN